MEVCVEFAGGAELLFGNRKSHSVTLPDNVHTMQGLIVWLRDNLLQERPDLFLTGANDTVRPGILVLVNDTDWELLDDTAYKLQPNDRVVFISTLHGG